jgi:phosphate transport system substrate-binding protein
MIGVRTASGESRRPPAAKAPEGRRSVARGFIPGRGGQGTVTALALSLPLALLTACGTPPALEEGALTGKVTLTGSSTLAPLMAEMATRFEGRHPGVRIDVQTGGSSRGIADATSGLADLGMASRGLTEEESGPLETHTVAYDGVAFVVHGSNPVAGLRREQLRALYTGQVTEWSAVGGSAGPVTVVTRAAGRSEVSLVTEYLDLAPEALAADLIAGENQHALKTVAGDPAALVYVSVGAAQRAAEAGESLKLLALDGVPASVETVAAGEYPLARPLNLLSPRDRPLSAAARAFLDFAFAAENHDLIDALAYVPPHR